MNEYQNELKKQVVRGIAWQSGAGLFQKVVSFCTTIILARYLGPSVFGLFSLAMIIISSFELFKSMGIDSALLRKRDNFQKAVNTAFMIIPLLGLILYIILNLSAPIFGEFFNNNDLNSIIRVLGVIFVINCLTKVPSVLLERNMQFKKISIAEFIVSILFSICAITFLFLDFGIWALVYASIIKIFIFMIIIWIFAKWKPKFEFDKKIALEMFHFGKFIFLTNIVWFLKMNLDNLLVGKLFDVTILGFYAVAFNIGNFAADYFGSKVYRVIYPAYSKLQNDLVALRSAFLKTIKYISMIALPFGVGVFILGDDFLKFTFGPKWTGAIDILKILVWAGIFNTLIVGMDALFLALGKPKISLFTVSLQASIFFILIIPIAKFFDIRGVGIVVSTASFIAFFIELILAMKLLSINLNQIYLCFKSSVISSLFMALGMIFFENVFFQHKIGILFNYKFIILFLFAVVIYGFSLCILEGKLLKSLKEIKELIF